MLLCLSFWGGGVSKKPSGLHRKDPEARSKFEKRI